MQETVSNRFSKFYSGNFDLTNELHSHPESKVNIDKLKVTIEYETFQNGYELSLKFGVIKRMILTHLAQIGKVKKNRLVGSI